MSFKSITRSLSRYITANVTLIGQTRVGIAYDCGTHLADWIRINSHDSHTVIMQSMNYKAVVIETWFRLTNNNF